jgi:hypothetical protein
MKSVLFRIAMRCLMLSYFTFLISNGRRIIRASLTALSDRLGLPDRKMRRIPVPAERRKVIGPFATTQTWPKYAPLRTLRGHAKRLTEVSSGPPGIDLDSMRLLSDASTGAEASLWQSAAA